MKFVCGLTAVLGAVLLIVGSIGHGGHPPHSVRSEASVPWPLEAVGFSPDDTVQAVNAWFEGVRNAEEAERLAALARLEAARAAANPAPAPAGDRQAATPAGSGCGVADQIRAAWADTPDGEWAVSVAMRESRCQPEARNPSGASGIFQLMMPLHRRLVADTCGEPADELVFDAACNIAAARALYQGAGRRPWAF